jgi:hypothetical protein
VTAFVRGGLAPRSCYGEFNVCRLRQVAADQSADRSAHSKNRKGLRNSSLTLITTTLNIFAQRKFYKRSFVRALPERLDRVPIN